MTATTPTSLLLAGLLVIVRVSAFLAIAPPFASRAVPVRVKAMLAVALSMPVIPHVLGDVPAAEAGPMLTAIAFQLMSGFAMGFVMLLLVSAIQAAGELLDVFAMFSMASLFDPFTNTQSSMFGRIQQLIATTLLFATGGHLLIVRGLLSSFQAIPLHTADLGGLARLMVADLGVFFVASIQICGPVILVLFCTDLAMGLVSRAVPSLNIFALNFPVKTMLVMSLGVIAISLVPAAIQEAITRTLEQMQPINRLLGG